MGSRDVASFYSPHTADIIINSFFVFKNALIKVSQLPILCYSFSEIMALY